MPKVSKAVREKRKDFAKTKLKVGKSKAAAANATDTTIRSRSIVLPKQSVNTDAIVKSANRAAHLLALVGHKSADARKEALQQLAALPNTDAMLKTQIIQAVCPLVCDDARPVRQAVLALLPALRPSRRLWTASVARFLLHVDGAMTHIQPAIRADSTRFLRLALELGDSESLVRQHLRPLLDKFAKLLGWEGQRSGLQSSKVVAIHLNTLHYVLDTALRERAAASREPPCVRDTFAFCESARAASLLAPCISLGIFDGGAAAVAASSNVSGAGAIADDADADPVLLHLPPMTAWLRARIVESATSDGTLVLPALRVVATLARHPRYKQAAGVNAIAKALEAHVDALDRIPGAIALQREICGSQ